MRIDKEKALALRKEGKTYKEIAECLDCSVAWCKANLVGTKVQSEDSALIEEIRCLGRSKEGVTNGEIFALTHKHYPTLKHKELKDKVVALKKHALRNNADVVLRPYWLIPAVAQNSVDMMLTLSQILHERIDLLTTEYMETYNLDETCRKSVSYGLCSLGFEDRSPLMPQGIMAYGDYLTSTIGSLEERNILDSPT